MWDDIGTIFSSLSNFTYGGVSLLSLIIVAIVAFGISLLVRGNKK